jgi:hypothetical protein
MMTAATTACALKDEPDPRAHQALDLAMTFRALDQCRLRHGLSPFKP